MKSLTDTERRTLTRLVVDEFDLTNRYNVTNLETD